MRYRTHYLTRKKLQLGLAWRFVLLLLLFAFFVGYQVISVVWPVVVEATPPDVIAAMKGQIFYRLLFFSLPFLFVLFASAVVFVHRVIGPLSRIEKTLDRVLKGEDVESIQLRKKDELKILTEKINGLIRMIKNRHTDSIQKAG
jgi:hypothetical protein